MFLLIDNYDSFSHNLARYLREAGAPVRVVRNDAVGAETACDPRVTALVVSPGPGRPEDAGISMEAIRRLDARKPLLGVCLGHQCLIEAFGGETTRALRPLHGEASRIRHCGDSLFQGIPDAFDVGRYHSLISRPEKNGALQIIAQSAEGEVMAVRHLTRPWYGVQFHPESLLTPFGRRMIENFIALAQTVES